MGLREKMEPTRKSGRLKKSRGLYAPTVAKIEYLQMFTTPENKEKENNQNEKSN